MSFESGHTFDITWSRRLSIALVLTISLVAVSPSYAAAPSDLSVNIDGLGSVSAPLQLVLLLTLLTFVPAALVIMTCFTRIAIVFHFLRQALGTQEMPSNQILIGLTLFLTVFIMAPVAEKVNERAVQPAIDGRLTVTAALAEGAPPLRDFMLKQTREIGRASCRERV